MTRLRLVHWNIEEAREKVQFLQSIGYEVDHSGLAPQILEDLKKNPPSVVVIDLSRLPMQGRDLAICIRHVKAIRNIPIIFVEGDSRKLDQIKTLLPDAVYTTYTRIRNAIKRAVAYPTKMTIVPKSIFEPYKNTPLVKKLGIKSDITIALIKAPRDFLETLGTLPHGVTIRKQPSSQTDLIILFAETQADLRISVLKIAAALTPNGRLWIAWRKKTSETTANLTQAAVRKTGLAMGLVDYKICSIDPIWTALLFAKRKTKEIFSQTQSR